MSVLFLLIFFFISLLIVGLVLLQEGKGGGLTGMSTGMDGVMGAKNPLRRMTAYLFVVFVLMCVFINWYFHQRVDTSLPSGLALPAVEQTLETSIPAPTTVGQTAVAEGALRPEAAADTVEAAPAAETATGGDTQAENGEAASE